MLTTNSIAKNVPPSTDNAPQFIEISTCCASIEEAHKIARLAVEKRLCACAHIIPIESYYRWQGEVTQDTEHKIFFKTTSKNAKALADLIKTEHSYALPAVVEHPLRPLTIEYGQWIQENSSETKPIEAPALR